MNDYFSDYSDFEQKLEQKLLIDYDQNVIYKFIEENFRRNDYKFVSMKYMTNVFYQLLKENVEKNILEKMLLTNEKLFFKIFLVLNYGSKCLLNKEDFNEIGKVNMYQTSINKICDIRHNINLFKYSEEYLFFNNDIHNLISEIIYFESYDYLIRLKSYINKFFKIDEKILNMVLSVMFESYSDDSFDNENFVPFDKFLLFKNFFNVKYNPIFIDKLLFICGTEIDLLNTLKKLEKQILFIENLSFHHKEALYTYTRHGDGIINTHLRKKEYNFNENNEYLKEVDPFDELSMYEEVKLYLLKYLNEIFEKIPKTKERIILFRKSMFTYPGEYLNENYISTSIDKVYINHLRGNMYTFEVKEGTSILPLMTLSHFDEGEVLINKNSELICNFKNCLVNNFGKKLKRKSGKNIKKKKSGKNIKKKKSGKNISLKN